MYLIKLLHNQKDYENILKGDYMKKLMTGNEALARGAYEAGVQVATGYPGTPSSEILENIVQYKEIYAEWSTNEKVATEAAIGAAYAGRRAITTMKQVGMNVASRRFFLFGLYRNESWSGHCCCR